MSLSEEIEIHLTEETVGDSSHTVTFMNTPISLEWTLPYLRSLKVALTLVNLWVKDLIEVLVPSSRLEVDFTYASVVRRESEG